MENNELIAVFMGATIEPGMENHDDPYYNYNAGWNMRRVSDMPYCESWDWLMPVCKRCYDISQNQDRPNVNACNRIDWLECEIGTALRECDISGTYLAVVIFINHYNSLQDGKE